MPADHLDRSGGISGAPGHPPSPLHRIIGSGHRYLGSLRSPDMTKFAMTVQPVVGKADCYRAGCAADRNAAVCASGTAQ